jgi:hypothetical protein
MKIVQFNFALDSSPLGQAALPEEEFEPLDRKYGNVASIRRLIELQEPVETVNLVRGWTPIRMKLQGLLLTTGYWLMPERRMIYQSLSFMDLGWPVERLNAHLELLRPVLQHKDYSPSAAETACRVFRLREGEGGGEGGGPALKTFGFFRPDFRGNAVAFAEWCWARATLQIESGVND